MILCDTAPLVALCDPRDGLHRRAMRDLDHLGRGPLVLCEPVLTEACFLLPHPTQRARLARLLEALQIGPFEVEDEAGHWRAAFEWLARYADQEPDWADAYLAVASGLEKKARVWTYDAEFRTVWRRPDGTKIPVAPR